MPYRCENWAYLQVDSAGEIKEANERAAVLLDDDLVLGRHVSKVLPWLRNSWFNRESSSRVVKTSICEKYLLDIIADSDKNKGFHVYFRNYYEYQDMDHLWCEVADAIIGVQRFIDTSYDGMLIADGDCKVLAINDAFIHISGLTREVMIGQNLQNLVSKGVLPYSCTVHAVQQRQVISASVKYELGKDAIVSSTPLYDEVGRIIRVISNVRDFSELNGLHEKLKSIKSIAKGYQRELQVMQIVNSDINRGLVRSRVMENLYELIIKVADTDLQLLITGESGVGKTAMAKFVHAASERNSTGSFIHVNCSAIPESLLESELFGYEEGSFTGAKKFKTGLFELAHKGTLFLDEIGDMPLSLQAKILNVLQERKFYRVGGVKEIEVDVRIIAATNTNLEQLITRGSFRQDLYYRLNVIPLRIPPLADRRDDILPLLTFYLEKSNQRYRRNKVITPDAIDVLLKYHWPGNIRELINLVERIVVIVDSPVVEAKNLIEVAENSDLLKVIQNTREKISPSKEKKQFWNPAVSLKDLVQMVEDEIIEEAVEGCGSLKEASKSLGVDVTTLIRKRNRKNKQLSWG